MKLLGRDLIVVMIAVLLGLGDFPAAAAERKPDLQVIYQPPRLSVEARGVNLRRVLEEIGTKVGFNVMQYGVSDKPLTVSIQDASLDEVLSEILRGENFAFIYGSDVKRIEKVILLSSAATAPAIAANQQPMAMRPQETVSRQAGLTYHSSFSQPANLAEQKRGDRAEAQATVQDIMRLHALSGLMDPAGGLSEPTNMAQAFPRQAGASFPAGRMTNPPPQNVQETLAATTRLAQQNLQALVEGLATASSSLFQSLPSGGR
jgi:hypothetical protein